jgi:enoyl-CoA hydratase/carnithine racemase
MSEPKRILVEIDDDVLRVTLNRPEVRNAQTPAMWDQLAEIAAAIPASVRFVVISGTGQDFSSGLDRAVLGEGMLTDLQSDPEGFIAKAQEGFARWTRIPQLVIAQVQGNAIGAGFQLALASDVIVAAPEARFAMREVSIGLVPDLGGTGALVDAIGYRRALALCATGAFLSAERAHEWGLVHTIADDPAIAVSQFLDQIRQLDQATIGDIKALLQAVAVDRDSWSRERSAQINRLATLLTGGTA